MKTVVSCSSKRQTYCLSAVLILLIFLSTEVRADLFEFSLISSNGTSSVEFAQQLCVEVTDLGLDRVSFTFYNNLVDPYLASGDIINGIITDVYFDDGMLSHIAMINNPQVHFSSPASPGHLPEGAAYGFEATSSFSADADPSPITNGVGVGESLTIMFNLVGINYSGLIDAIALGFENGFAAGSLQIGLHVQNLPGPDEDGNWSPTAASDTYIMTPVPVPGAAILGLLGLGAVGLKLRRFT